MNEESTFSPSLPTVWKSNPVDIVSFLEKRTESDYAMVALRRNELVGYMLFEAFPFHGEITAFCAIAGHASTRVNKKRIYASLYQAVSEKLVASGILSHAITYFAHDECLRETVYELGFGLIVVDAFRRVIRFPIVHSSFDIVQADASHTEAIEALGKESVGYYLGAPIFLKRDIQSRDYYRSLFDQKSAIFLAFDHHEPIGFMRIRKNRESDPIILCDPDTGLIDQVGAYVKPAYRGRGIGTALLFRCVQWSRNHDVTRIHVDFESANLSGRSFWLKYFTASMHSARRAIYRDVRRHQET